MSEQTVFNERDFHFLKNVTVDELANEHYITSMVNFINTLDSKIMAEFSLGIKTNRKTLKFIPMQIS